MKREIILLTAVLIIVSCDKIDELTQFEMDYETEYTVESSAGIDIPIDIASPDIKTNSETTFQNNNTNKDLIEQIMLTELTLTVTQPSDADFSFLKSIEISIDAEGLPEKRVAWSDQISSSAGNEISLETTGDDLKDYIKKENFVLKMSTVTDEFFSSDHVIEAYSRFFVDAEILGQ